MDVCVLEGQIVVVTGGTGVGAAMALAAARARAAIGVRESRGRR